MISTERLKTFLSYLLPVLLLLLVLCAVVGGQGLAAHLDHGLSEEAYASLAVVRSLVETSIYAIGDGPDLPLLRDTLWRMGLWMFVGDGEALLGKAIVMSGLYSLGLLILALGWARKLDRSLPFHLITGLLLVMAPSLLGNALSATSLAQSGVLVTGAFLLHMRALESGTKPLSVTAAVLLGLAAWNRIELVLLWAVLGLHAAFVRHCDGRVGARRIRGTLRGVWLLGCGLIAVLLSPVLMRNLGTLDVLWPRGPGAVLALDTLRTAPLVGLHAYLTQVGVALPEAYRVLGETPLFSSMVMRAITLIGLAVLATMSVRSDASKARTLPLFVLVLTPLVYALAQPFLGWVGADQLYGVLEPLAVVTAAYGLWMLQPFAERFVSPLRLKAWPVWAWPSLLGAAMLTALCFASFATARELVARRTDQVRWVRARAAVLKTLDSLPGSVMHVATDQPGWLCFHRGGVALDLNGQFTRDVLASMPAVSAEGALDADKLGSVLRREQPELYIFWSTQPTLNAWGVKAKRVEIPGIISGAPLVYRAAG